MALPISKFRWISYIFLFFLSLFIFNKWIVMQVLGDVWRAKFLRFQLSCAISFFIFLMSVFVWKNISNYFDKDFERPPNEISYSWSDVVSNTLDIRGFFNWKKYSIQSKLWRFFILIILVSSYFSYMTFSFLIGTNPYWISTWLFLCFGILVQLFSGTVIVKIVSFICNIVLKIRHANKHKSRKLKQTVVLIYAVVIITIGYRNTLQPPEIKSVKIPIKDLPESLDQLTITFIPDIHLGPTIGLEKLEKIVNTVNYLYSDLVIIGGDLLDGRVDQLKDAVEPIGWIKSKYGTYFVTGNHEYYTTDIHNWFPVLRRLGVQILHNTNVWLPSAADKGLCLAGVDDPTADSYKFMDHGLDIEGSLRHCDTDSPVILVAHQPKVAKLALQTKQRVDLVLSGHTHGGQMFPLTIGAYLFNPYYAGLYRHGDSHVYVSMGTMYWGFPVRFLTRSEITKITLVNADNQTG